ncbi:MAG: extracellular solute-binding protein [Lachnospiraceae bacterium]|nr:extracellular solute-binding protein [Lachnospiraceae bacterium]
MRKTGVKRAKKWCALLMAAVCLVTMFAGCGKSGGKRDEDGKISLLFWSIYPEGDPNYEWMMSVIERFEKEHDDIRIHYTGISFWDYFTKITTAMTDPTGPDIYLQTIKDTADRARGGVSMNLTPFFDESFHAGTEFFYEEDVLPMTYEGNVYGVPYALDNRVLYYNIDLVNALKDSTDEDWMKTKVAAKEGTTIAGRPKDLIGEDGNVRAPETYDELLAYQELLTVTENGKITQLGFDVNVGNFKIENVVWTNGGEYFDGKGNPIVDTDPGVRKGFEVWYELTHTLSSARVNAFLDTAGDNTTNLFWSGKVAVMIATNEIPWQNDKLGEQKIHLGAAPVPYNRVEENHYNFTGGFSLELAQRLAKEDKEVQQAAFDFIKYLCSEEVQVEVLTVSSNMPANIKSYDTLFASISDPEKVVVLEEMAHRKAFDYIYDAPNWWGEIQNALTDYTADKRSLDQTLQRAQNAILQLKASY